MLRFKLAVVVALSLLVPFAGACAQGEPKVEAATVKVVASFSILADLVRQVGGGRVEVTSLVGPDAELHGFEPTPADVRRLAGAQLFVINGLGVEGWSDRLAQSSGFKGTTVIASRGLQALAADEDHDKHDAHAHHHDDPHAWQSVANVKRYVANIRDALIAVDPAGRGSYEAQAARYSAELDGLEHDIAATFTPIPKERRRVITSHDAFAYFAAAYGVTFLAPQGVGNEAEPSAHRVAELIRQIRKEGVKVVFWENISSPRVIERIARETGAKPGGTLYSDALSGPQGPAPTYIAMMRHNVKLFADSLTGK